jgi:hypothetical protein
VITCTFIAKGSTVATNRLVILHLNYNLRIRIQKRVSAEADTLQETVLYALRTFSGIYGIGADTLQEIVLWHLWYWAYLEFEILSL